MAHRIRVHAGNTNVQLPDGSHHDAGDTVTLTDEQFSRINQNDFASGGVGGGPLLDDLGVTGTSGDQVTTQAADVANLGALTAATVATANATDLASAQALANALKTAVNAIIVDLAANRTVLNTLLTNLRTPSGPMA